MCLDSISSFLYHTYFIIKFNGQVKVLDKDGVPLKVTVEDLDGENKQVTFTPQEPGDLHVSVKWSDKTVPNGEFDVEVGILLAKMTAAQNKFVLSYHRVHGLFFLTVIFAATVDAI